MRIKIILLCLLFISLTGCLTATKPLTLPFTTVVTDTETPRWQLYEAALLGATIGEDKEGLCEWTILGITGNEVYVYTQCQANGEILTAASVPAVIYLGEHGEMRKYRF